MEDAIVFHSGVARSHEIFWLSSFHFGSNICFLKAGLYDNDSDSFAKHQSTVWGVFSVTEVTLHLRF